MAPLTPRQVAVRAQEAAGLLLSLLDREGLVARFLNSYAKEAKRPGRTANPERFRELVETIRHESLLVVILEVEQEIPIRLGVRIGRRATPAQSTLIKLFREEFYAALRRGLDWGDEDFAAFSRDLELYRRLYGTFPVPGRSRAASVTPKGPFVDRCGILLDPSMLDMARRAAAKFEAELMAAAFSGMKKVFSRR
ncbi:MAG TPA: hypothetical protein VGR72_06090 [Candidatus Acidoferrales bacterium]|nr:hypothetical protein [Candidatus Acidoferrales bacterium]